MKKSRRNFIKQSGLAAGFTLAGGVAVKNYAFGNNINDPEYSQRISDIQKKHTQSFNMSGFVAPIIPIVRVGLIGLGQRGPAHLKVISTIEDVKIRALCDLRPEKVVEANKLLKNSDHNPELYSGGEDEWKKLCEQKDLDLIIVTTPWYMHAKIAIYAMQQGKHVAIEAPAAATVEEAWQLVKTAEQTRKHCMMLENTSYMDFQLLTLNMARHGFFGEVVHGDCAYNTSKMNNNFNKNLYWNMWWLRQYGSREGNIYPTHGLGPVAQIMNINRGDRFDFLVSVESKDFMMKAKAEELAKKDSSFKEFAKMNYRGNMNVTIIKTVKGSTIMLQHDATPPSPHSMIHGVYGTKGAALMDSPEPRISTGNHKWTSKNEFEKIADKYTHEITKKFRTTAKESGHGEKII